MVGANCVVKSDIAVIKIQITAMSLVQESRMVALHRRSIARQALRSIVDGSLSRSRSSTL
jgi:hypothetical protein